VVPMLWASGCPIPCCCCPPTFHLSVLPLTSSLCSPLPLQEQLPMGVIGGAVDMVVVPIVVPVSLVTLAPIVICHVICLLLCWVVSMKFSHGPRPYLHGFHVICLRVSCPSSLSPPTFYLCPCCHSACSSSTSFLCSLFPSYDQSLCT
jgi:hypothetical protein